MIQLKKKKKKNQEITHWEESLEISCLDRDQRDIKIVQSHQDWMSGNRSISILHFLEQTPVERRDRSTVEKQVSIQTTMNETVTYQWQLQLRRTYLSSSVFNEPLFIASTPRG